MADNTNDKSGKKIDYDFAAHERPLFDAWMDAGYFQRTPELGAGTGQPYTIVIPPPNITGVLHMGHALNDTIQDTCIRRARMQGRPTRWILGPDHAGISTQTKVDKKLADQGISRLEIGREAFIEACYDWYKEYGTTIVNQIKGMGCSCDYADEHFTLEPAYVKAVRKLFVDWYHDDLIYKGKRIVNWCPHCTTSISDDEAEYVDEAGHLWYLRYPLTEPEDGLEYLVVATTRPETMLGDTGVAVNPKDERFKHLVGKTVKLPLVDREIPIFADWHVDREFGTGCVKTTPAHDPNDWAMGERNGLERINIFDETAHVVDGFGAFSGMDRDEAREAVVAAFDELAERGFTVLMDDFGSGYSSLNMLKDINVDVLKIDMRFLDRDDRRSKDIMESVIRMARWLDLPVIAEGVETREQVNFLLDVGCSYAQGYYYARPMEAAAFEALLTDGSKVQHEQCALQDARRPILDFRDLLHENTISDRMLSSIIGSVALYSYADGDLRLIRGNEAYRRLIATLGEGVNGAEEGGSLLPFVHDEDRDALVAAAEETVRSCPDDGVEVVVRRMGTNGCHWHKMRLFHLNTTNGSATVYGSVTDVTERMEYMEALRKSEQRFEMTLEASGTVVFELDIPTRTARYSEFLQQAFGLAETVANAPEGFIEQGTVAEESIEDFRAIYRDLYAGAPRTSAVVRAIMGDGSRAWNRVTLLAMPNEAGAPVKAVGLVENVTRETEMDLLLKRLGRFEQD